MLPFNWWDEALQIIQDHLLYLSHPVMLMHLHKAFMGTPRLVFVGTRRSDSPATLTHDTGRNGWYRADVENSGGI